MKEKNKEQEKKDVAVVSKTATPYYYSCFDFTQTIVELQPLKKTFKIIQITMLDSHIKKRMR